MPYIFQNITIPLLVSNLLQSCEVSSTVSAPSARLFPLNQGVVKLSWGSGEEEDTYDSRKFHSGAFCAALFCHFL